jgi:hypothetical protein
MHSSQAPQQLLGSPGSQVFALQAQATIGPLSDTKPPVVPPLVVPPVVELPPVVPMSTGPPQAASMKMAAICARTAAGFEPVTARGWLAAGLAAFGIVVVILESLGLSPVKSVDRTSLAHQKCLVNVD